jgi:hypothetical protein
VRGVYHRGATARGGHRIQVPARGGVEPGSRAGRGSGPPTITCRRGRVKWAARQFHGPSRVSGASCAVGH